MLDEDVAVNNVGGGAVAGLGVGSQGEPGIQPGKTPMFKRKFAGHPVFEVDSEKFYKCRMGKKKYERYENYVGNDEIGESIRQYGRKNYNKPIIVQDSTTGAMMYLRYGKRN